jgi:stearoyl-CoA desaturase (delta-9 desaturase)
VVAAIIVAALGGWFTIMCLSVYAHRSIAHRALTLGPIPSHIMRFWLWFTTGVSVRRWVAVHRKHHVYTDVEGDPHSPALFGLARIFFLGYYYYKREALNDAVVEQYGKDCPNDWLERNVYEKHTTLPLLVMGGLYIAIFGLWAGLVGYVISIIWVSFWAAGVINGIAHAIGYRNWATKDTSRNIVPIGFLSSGEELHNNHHRWPRSAKFSMKWYEFDAGWALIRLCYAFGQASDIYVKNRRWKPEKLHVELPDVEDSITESRPAA